MISEVLASLMVDPPCQGLVGGGGEPPPTRIRTEIKIQAGSIKFEIKLNCAVLNFNFGAKPSGWVFPPFPLPTRVSSKNLGFP